MDILNLVSDLLIVLVLLIPIILGIKRGFVDTALRFGKTIIAFALASLFAKPVGAWVKGLIHPTVSEKMLAFFEGETAETLNASTMLDKVPEGVKTSLSVPGFDVEGMAKDAAAKGEEMIESFAGSLSNSVSGALAYVIAFAGIFLLALILVPVMRMLLNFIVKRLPIIRTLNRLLGALMGALIGLMFAWMLSHALAWVLGAIAHNNWTDTYLLSFFHKFNPLRWIFSVAIESISSIATVG